MNIYFKLCVIVSDFEINSLLQMMLKDIFNVSLYTRITISNNLGYPLDVNNVIYG